MPAKVTICWFRQDLRLHDNPALFEAARQGAVLPIYILDDENAGSWRLGGASRLWLHHSLTALNDSLEGKLLLYRGKAEDVISRLCQNHGINAVYWNRCYEPWRIKRDRLIKERLHRLGTAAASFNGSLLWEPWEILKKDQTPYKIFTPFYNRALSHEASVPIVSFSAPPKLVCSESDHGGSSVDDLELRPDQRWCSSLEKQWRVGETNASQVLAEFIKSALQKYQTARDFPDTDATSRLSPYLHFGEISAQRVWQRLGEAGFDEDVAAFKRQLVWREFCHYLLYHNPQIAEQNLKPKFDSFPWQNNRRWLQRWQQGLTGYPLVDAGMRELWQTGSMHNRVRMIVASFLVKNLLVHWRYGADWFWDCLVDADLANNSANWQWVAGCGTDAAPYFRIFNPVSQGLKFDPEGIYTRRFVPELKNLPRKYLFCPWEAPASILTQAGIKLGENYPLPIVEQKLSRQRALEAFKTLV